MYNPKTGSMRALLSLMMLPHKIRMGADSLVSIDPLCKTSHGSPIPDFTSKRLIRRWTSTASLQHKVLFGPELCPRLAVRGHNLKFRKTRREDIWDGNILTHCAESRVKSFRKSTRKTSSNSAKARNIPIVERATWFCSWSAAPSFVVLVFKTHTRSISGRAWGISSFRHCCFSLAFCAGRCTLLPYHKFFELLCHRPHLLAVATRELTRVSFAPSGWRHLSSEYRITPLWKTAWPSHRFMNSLVDGLVFLSIDFMMMNNSRWNATLGAHVVLSRIKNLKLFAEQIPSASHEENAHQPSSKVIRLPLSTSSKFSVPNFDNLL